MADPRRRPISALLRREAGRGRATRRRGRERTGGRWSALRAAIRRGRMRRIGAIAVLAVGLLGTGGLYVVVVPQPQLASAQGDAALLAEGRRLYSDACITCHGSNLQGVPGRGPSLVGAGDAAVYFQVSSGRMPLPRPDAQARRTQPRPEFDPGTPRGMHNLQALGAYVQANGGGPQRPAGSGAELVGSDTARGSELFRLNCSACHNFTGRGGVLLDGKHAPNLQAADPEQIYTAMLSGPQAMPAFTDRQLTPDEKEDIIAYVLSVRGERNAPGGFNLGELGPVPEGLVAFVVGLVALVCVTAWLGSRS